MHINKRYIFLNEATQNETVLELDLGAKELSVLVYEGIEQQYPYVATLNQEHNTELLLAVLDLFTLGKGLLQTKYVTIGGH